ncbi:hypothetical protein GCM10027570_35730 [Streptomonospora sediminis]
MDLSNYDHPDDIESDGTFVYVDPEKLRQGSAGLRIPADAMDQLVNSYENFVNQLGEPWGSTDDEFGEGAKKKLLPLMKDYPKFLREIGTALHETADETLVTERNQSASEEYGEEIGNNFKDGLNDIGGGGGGRRG